MSLKENTTPEAEYEKNIIFLTKKRGWNSNWHTKENISYNITYVNKWKPVKGLPVVMFC